MNGVLNSLSAFGSWLSKALAVAQSLIYSVVIIFQYIHVLVGKSEDHQKQTLAYCFIGFSNRNYKWLWICSEINIHQ